MPNRYEGPKVIAALSPHIVMPAQAGIHLRGNDIAEHTLSWGCVKSHLFYSKSLPAACIASTESDFLGLFAQPHPQSLVIFEKMQIRSKTMELLAKP